MKRLVVLNLMIVMACLPLHAMDALYIKRTIPIARHSWDAKRRKSFVRAAVNHLKTESLRYQERLKQTLTEEQKTFFKDAIMLDLCLLEQLGECDFESFVAEGPLVQETLGHLQDDLGQICISP